MSARDDHPYLVYIKQGSKGYRMPEPGAARRALDEIEGLRAERETMHDWFDRMREAARAFSELNAVYRTGGRPSEKLFKRLETARVTMQELGAS